MTKNEALTVLGEMQATWPQRALDDLQVAVWLDTLAPMPLDAARAGLRRLRESLNFPPSHHEFLAASNEERRRLASRTLAERTGPCAECGDDQWVQLGRRGGSAVPTVRPCSRCLPVQYVRWSEGHLAAEHRCSECTDLAKGSAETRRDTLEKILARCVRVDLEAAF